MEQIGKNNFERLWDAFEWQNFSTKIVQLRHGAQNVQTVPDKVDGDAGLEFFTTDGCLYQCYAPQEAFEPGKSASAMKSKATQDLKKLWKYQEKIQGIVGNLSFNRWILLCPFFDDKDVLRHVSRKVTELKCNTLSFAEDDFVGVVHSQENFSAEIQQLRSRNAGLPLIIRRPTDGEVEDAKSELLVKVEDKLRRGYPNDTAERREKRGLSYIRSSIMRSNFAEQLRNEYPDVWDAWFQAVALEEERLEMMGPVGGPANELLARELERIESKLTQALSTLAPNAISTLANGQIGAWLIDCPLDFE